MKISPRDFIAYVFPLHYMYIHADIVIYVFSVLWTLGVE